LQAHSSYSRPCYKSFITKRRAKTMPLNQKLTKKLKQIFGNKFFRDPSSVELLDELKTVFQQATDTGADVTAPYLSYVALLTQSGTNAPVATVLENTIGDIVWSTDGINGRH